MLTRRDRLERIAAAERDRRAGHLEVAVAALGEGSEWPARVVLALARLPEEEGADSREILMAGLDAWAEESGLDPLSPALEISGLTDASGIDDEDSLELDAGEAEEASAVPLGAHAGLDEPIEHDELEAAFAAAETQVDEMMGVNDVAERVLLDEPTDLAELTDQADLAPLDFGDADLGEDEQDAAEDLSAGYADDAPSEGTDAAWAAAPIWPSSTGDFEADRFDVLGNANVGADSEIQFGSSASFSAGLTETFSDSPEDGDSEETGSSRGVALATLERWLANIQMHRARSARPVRPEGEAQ